ncbi:Translation initiation factor 2B subunit, eIF-2B alpha/beta/delta family [Haladaptatus litoreus]|uniref:Translation initiation factor 2B subunit, eIF-2B alpha/beta/delta family n=1 Tax=Haladaptatus litoreus TaxID=553468 RepID=A0A1N6UVU9_9EURY|nr:NUDIX domain-containing protein [Haladaptatus litoreus]SIQ69738.1 Translation initiation factor 2B subunit, eIF-2B alpha/beta/delta family [Haladaptatus litoreus]
MDQIHVVTCFLRNRGDVLLLQRSEQVGSYAGLWGGVAGHAEGDPDALAREEIEEETGLLSACTFVRAGDTFEVEDESLGKRWIVHPYLFDCASRAVEPHWETTEMEWVSPTEILRRETVPDLWKSYAHVAPSVESVAKDAEHGSAYISIRALETLRDRAGLLAVRDDDWDELAELATELRSTRPSMAVLENRVNRVMAEADSPTAVEQSAIEGIDRAYRVDEEATENARERIADSTVLTLSRSGTVLDALRGAKRVFVAESRPACEGVGVAEELTESTDVTLHTDAGIGHVLATEDVDSVVVGADSVLPNGDVVNKTGTRLAATAANREDVPVFVVTSTDKVRLRDGADRPELESGDSAAVYDGDRNLSVLNQTFDVTPAEFITGYVTERGLLGRKAVRDVGEELRSLAGWRDDET